MTVEVGSKTLTPSLQLFHYQGYPPGLDGHGLGQAKTKRARTSFKHHQLRIMKAHFQINQNPDSRELKMLSQKTGLDKKVLQVSQGSQQWFLQSSCIQAPHTCPGILSTNLRFLMILRVG